MIMVILINQLLHKNQSDSRKFRAQKKKHENNSQINVSEIKSKPVPLHSNPFHRLAVDVVCFNQINMNTYNGNNALEMMVPGAHTHHTQRPEQYWPTIIERPSNDWIFSIEDIKLSPSVQSGMSIDDELIVYQKCLDTFVKASRNLKLHRSNIFFAMVYLFRFYQRCSMQHFKWLETAQACLYLASKKLENHRGSKAFALAFARFIRPDTDETTKEYWKWREALENNEEILLEMICFDTSIKNPYEFYEFLIDSNPSHIDLRNDAISKIENLSICQIFLLYDMEKIFITLLVLCAIRKKINFPLRYFEFNINPNEILEIKKSYESLIKRYPKNVEQLGDFLELNVTLEDIENLSNGSTSEYFVDHGKSTTISPSPVHEENQENKAPQDTNNENAQQPIKVAFSKEESNGVISSHPITIQSNETTAKFEPPVIENKIEDKPLNETDHGNNDKNINNNDDDNDDNKKEKVDEKEEEQKVVTESIDENKKKIEDDASAGIDAKSPIESKDQDVEMKDAEPKLGSPIREPSVESQKKGQEKTNDTKPSSIGSKPKSSIFMKKPPKPAPKKIKHSTESTLPEKRDIHEAEIIEKSIEQQLVDIKRRAFKKPTPTKSSPESPKVTKPTEPTTPTSSHLKKPSSQHQTASPTKALLSPGIDAKQKRNAVFASRVPSKSTTPAPPSSIESTTKTTDKQPTKKEAQTVRKQSGDSTKRQQTARSKRPNLPIHEPVAPKAADIRKLSKAAPKSKPKNTGKVTRTKAPTTRLSKKVTPVNISNMEKFKKLSSYIDSDLSDVDDSDN